MSEAAVVRHTPEPRTRQSLAADLTKLGLTDGMTVLVHSSLSAIGWVCGGPVTVVQALMDVITPAGTIVMPTQSTDYSDPSHWQNPPVPTEWWQVIRDTMPAFDPRITPTRGMGQIVETFRAWPGVQRSSHPAVSFAAWGRRASAIVSNHSLDHSLGECSPLARLNALDGRVLLLGVGYDTCTCFHLAQYRTAGANRVEAGAPVWDDGQRVWKTYHDIDLNTDGFAELGADFERAGHVQVGLVGSAQARLFPVQAAVDFAARWFTAREP